MGNLVIKVEVDEHTAGHLKAITEMYECSISEAAQTVLERYSKRAKSEIERVIATVENITKD